MSDTYDERDEERDWPDEHAPHVEKIDPPLLPVSEDDAARLPTRYHTRHKTQQRRGAYRPPSELDRD